ncbi:outer membrane protein [Rhizobium setariae]|nr:outer membrane protein [Rhizobium setariae]
MTIRRSLATVAITLGFASAAAAFDMPPPIDAPEIETDGIASTTSGWYIRGDLGYNVSTESDAPTYRNYNFATDSYVTNSFDKHRFSNNVTLNTGAGYQFNEFLRTDLTLDYFGSTFKGKADRQKPCTFFTGNGAYGSCAYKQQDMTALGLLANGYVDLGTYWGLTPYVGAGAGVSYVKWGDVEQSRLCHNTNSCGGIDFTAADQDGADSWRFTYALMAGMSYDVTENMKLDFGYRYSQIDGGDMFGFSRFETAAGAFGTKGKDKGLSRHEFRTGIRMMTW